MFFCGKRTSGYLSIKTSKFIESFADFCTSERSKILIIVLAFVAQNLTVS